MNGVHDLGGMHGFGPIEREADEPRFHADWEARAMAINSLVLEQGYFTVDAHRYGIERMAPADYLRASYYERWLASLESILIQQGIMTGDELDARVDLLRRRPDAALQRDTGAAPPPAPSARPGPTTPPPAPRFAVGDAVMARNIHPTGHTRLPRYVRGKRGVINFVYEPQVFPDTNAHGLGEHPQVVYNVRFDGRELWGDSAEPRQTVSIDLWESYLEPAPR
jgi:nitrile hydratase subunit beta